MSYWWRVYGSQIKKKTDRQAKPNPNDSQCGTLEVGSNMVNDSSFMHCHTGGVFIAAKWTKDRQTEPNPNDSQCGTLKVGSNMVNDSSFMHCHTGGVFMAAKLKKKTDRQNLTLMTLNVEPWKLGPMWLMTLLSCIVILVACLWQPN